jgi:hypothetical protein
MLRALLLASALAVPGCEGQHGTLRVSLVTSPGSSLLAEVQTLRATLTEPYTVTQATRAADGLALDLEVPAEGRLATLTVEGFSAAGDRVAVGRTPPLPIGAITADLAVFMAPPMSVTPAATSLSSARTAIGAGLLPYGVLLAGGADSVGAATAHLEIYSAYSHSLIPGEPLPSARADLAVAIGATGLAYLFGGRDSAGTDTGTLWRFDTDAQPAGTHEQLADLPALARSGAVLAAVGSDRFLVSGQPVALVDGLAGSVQALASPARLPDVAVSVQDDTLPGDPIYSVFIGAQAGATGIVRYSEGQFFDEPAPADAQRTGHAAVPTPDDDVVAIGGGDTTTLLSSAIRVNPGARQVESFSDILLTPRRDAAIATNGTVLLVAGGTDSSGEVVAEVELIELSTLDHLGSTTLTVPRSGARAYPLPNGQILIVGGTDSSAAPTSILELFTPTFAP